jgi:hypothetical protein
VPDAAPDAAPDAMPEAAPASDGAVDASPDAAPGVERFQPRPRRIGSAGPGTCDRRIDYDCDGIPDVR